VGLTLETVGVILSVFGGSMIAPAVLLHKRAGHLVAPRPIVLVFLSAGLMIVGVSIMLIGKLGG
jgi:hypothetical protein